MLPVYAFTLTGTGTDTTYTGYNGTTDASGQVVFTLPQGSYRFRADYNGTQFWSDPQNSCTVPDCSIAAVTVTIPMTVTVKDTDGTAKAGLPVYAFDGTTYTSYNGTTDTNGQISFTLPQGSYRFRADLDGTQFWSSADNTYTLPGCTVANITVTDPLTVTVKDSAGTAKAGLSVYAFTLTGTGDGTAYTGYTATTDTNGQVSFSLPQGNYRFRADLNGTQFWSSADNTCSLPGCTSADITVTIPLTVTVQDTDGTAKAGLPVYAFTLTGTGTDTTYTGYNGTTDASGQVAFTLPQGSYRFRADLNGTQFWSSADSTCVLPGCTASAITVSKPVTVTVASQTGQPYAGLQVYAFDGTSYTGYNGTTDTKGQVSFTLQQGSYRFQADYNGVQFWSGNENSCTLPGCTAATVTLPGGQSAATNVTINYTYDPLYRLTAADYSDGKYFHYTYDAVGNRLTQDANPSGQPASTSYTYDEANRLTSVGGVSYTWDANGNLLNDGTNSYTYDSANRLTAVSGKQTSVNYVYNGLGDRLQQVVNGNKTTYVNDLNAGLTQVLDDGTNTYLYGNDRIAQSPISNSQSTIQYFLGDALGSVRQMANESGALVYTASYDPYGEVLSASGEAQTSYGYTSEETDSYIKLIDLRSRLYSPEIGRFLTQDSWQGDYNNPLSLNKWLYDYGNPIDAVDPSGYITEQEASAADSDVNELAVLFNIQIKEDWGYQLVPEMPEPDIITEMMIPSLRFGCGWKQGNWRNVHELDLVLQAVKDFSRKLGPGDTV
jgi:RHS repeat-associated protein